MTPEERIQAVQRSLTVPGADAIHAEIHARVVGPPELLALLGIRAGLSAGFELGLRAAFLDPVAAERIRDAYGDGFAEVAGFDDADHVNAALHKVQHVLEAAGRP